MESIILIWLALTIGLAASGVDSAKVNITVSDAPKLVGLLDELNNPEGTNATITCSVGSGNLQGLAYEWYKDDERLLEGNPRIARKIRIEAPSDNYLSILRVFNLEPGDAGLYSCVAKNRFGQDKISTKLNVKVQLKWTVQPPADMTVSAGQALHVPCLASGSPMPHTSWFRVDEDSNRTQENLGYELRFSSVKPEHAGLYECRASNGAEEDLATRIKLDVLVGKSPKIVDQPERLNHPEETNAVFTCSIGSGELNGLTFEWFKDDKKLAQGDNSRKIRISTVPDNFQSTLRVLDLKSNDSGQYSCVAKNAYGQDRITTKLFVKVQLKWTSKPGERVEVPAGRPLHVPCSADGQPRPSIEWTKLDGQRRVRLGAELRFDSPNQQDAGLYECKASNGQERNLIARTELSVLGK